jgi:uncharacterized protein (UPF0262 family)
VIPSLRGWRYGAEGALIGTANSAYRIMAIELSDGLAAHSALIRQETQIAIHDILEHNQFRPKGSPGGPYRLVLQVAENRLVLEISLSDFSSHGQMMLSLTPFRGVIREYQAVCESYSTAMRESHLTRLEAVDHGRRGLHDEGAQLLIERLQGRIEVDFDTARRLFTLISALCLKPSLETGA